MTARRGADSVAESRAELAVQGPWAPGPVAEGVLALATLLLTLHSGAAPWRRALGSELGEADNHLWMWWRASRWLVGQRGPWTDLPVGEALPLMDPAHLPPYLLGAVIDPVVGWNLVAAWAVLLAMAGGRLLGRELGGPQAGPLAGTVAMVACGASPFLAGVIDFGITEAWGLGWLGLHAGLLLRFLRTGRTRDALLAGLCLGALALTGAYAALFGLVAEVGLLLWALSRGGARRLPGLLGQGLLALLMALPLAWVTAGAAPAWQGRFHAPSPVPPPPRPDWRELPVFGTDLLNLLLPSWERVDPSKAVYLGLPVLLLAAWGLLRRPRQVGPLLLIALPLLLLALGPWPAVAGRPLGLPGPAFLLARVPALQGLSHWHRAVGLAVPLLAAAAGLGAASLGPRLRAPAAGALCGLLLLDGLLLGQTPWPRRSHPVDAPAVLLAAAALAPAQGPRGVIQIPFDNGRAMFSAEPARLYDRWQVHHGLPRAESYESRDSLLARSPLVAGWQAATGLPLTLPPEQRPPPAMRDRPPLTEPAAVVQEVRQLRAWGYGFVVLHPGRAPDAAAARAAVEAALGSGIEVEGEVLWTLPEG